MLCLPSFDVTLIPALMLELAGCVSSFLFRSRADAHEVPHEWIKLRRVDEMGLRDQDDIVKRVIGM